MDAAYATAYGFIFLIGGVAGYFIGLVLMILSVALRLVLRWLYRRLRS
jgi:hypothetical protein